MKTHLGRISSGSCEVINTNFTWQLCHIFRCCQTQPQCVMSKLLIWHYGSFRHVNMWTVWRIIYNSQRDDLQILYGYVIHIIETVQQARSQMFQRMNNQWHSFFILQIILDLDLYIFHNTLPVLVSSVHQIKRSKVKCKCHARVMSPPTQPHYNNITPIIILVSGLRLSFISEQIDVRGMEFCSLTSRITAAMSGHN